MAARPTGAWAGRRTAGLPIGPAGAAGRPSAAVSSAIASAIGSAGADAARRRGKGAPRSARCLRFGIGNVMLNYHFKVAKEGEDALDWDDSEATITSFDVHVGAARQLLLELHGIFLDLVAQVKEAGADSSRVLQACVQSSRLYRTALDGCILKLEEKLEMLDGHGRMYAKVIAEMNAFKVAAALWQLCELLLLDRRPSVTASMVDFMQRHVLLGLGDAERVQLEAAAESGAPETASIFWQSLQKLIAIGQTAEAADLLLQHSRVDELSQSIGGLADALRAMPHIHSVSGLSSAEFHAEWTVWQESLLQLLRLPEMDEQEQLRMLVELLRGDEDALKLCCKSWDTLLTARLLYRFPTLKRSKLAELTAQCVEQTGGQAALQQKFHELLLDVMSVDVVSYMRAVHGMGLTWFSAHLADLLTLAGVLPDELPMLEISLRETYMLEYSNTLMTHAGLWQLAANYLTHCPKRGPAMLERFIERVPPSTDETAYKLLSLCTAHGLSTQHRSICRVRAAFWLARSRHGAAVLWYLRGEDYDSVEKLCKRVVQGFLRFSDDPSRSTFDAFRSESYVRSVEHIVDAVSSPEQLLLSPSLALLSRLRELRLVAEDIAAKKGNEAELRFCRREFARRFTKLFTAKYAPRQYWLELLWLATPMMTLRPAAFDFQQTVALQVALQEALACHSAAAAMKRVSAEAVSVISMALAQNLATATLDSERIAGADGSASVRASRAVAASHSLAAT